MNFLIQERIDVDVRCNLNYTPLSIACYAGQSDIVSALIVAGARVDEGLFSLIGTNLSILKILMLSVGFYNVDVFENLAMWTRLLDEAPAYQ